VYRYFEKGKGNGGSYSTRHRRPAVLVMATFEVAVTTTDPKRDIFVFDGAPVQMSDEGLVGIPFGCNVPLATILTKGEDKSGGVRTMLPVTHHINYYQGNYNNNRPQRSRRRPLSATSNSSGGGDDDLGINEWWTERSNCDGGERRRRPLTAPDLITTAAISPKASNHKARAAIHKVRKPL